MIVSVSTFYEELNEYQPELLLGQIKTIQYFRPIYHGVENGFSTENLYIGTVSQLPQEVPATPCCYLLLQDTPIPEPYLQASQNTYLLLSKEYGGLDLFALTSAIFENQVMVGLLSADLLQSVKIKAELDTILQQGYDVLQTPLLLIDRFLNVLAYAGTEQIDFSVSLLQNLFKEENQIDTAAPGEYVIYEMAAQKDFFIAGRIMRDHSPAAYLIGTFNGGRINDRIHKLFQVLCNFLELRMQNDVLYRQDSYAPGNTFLHDLLRGKYQAADDILKHQERIGLRFYDYLFIVALEHQRDNSTDDQLHLLHFQLNTILGSYYWVNEHGILLLLCDSKNKTLFSETQYIQLKKFLDEMDFRAVISLPFTALDDFALTCRQTISGLSVLRHKKPMDHVVFYEDIMIDHMLLTYGDIVPLKKIVPDYIWQLYAIDAEKNLQFVHTLFSYIEHGQNMNETASALYIHYNTLKYRMNRIIEITKLDLSSSDVILKLLLTKHILVLLGKEA